MANQLFSTESARTYAILYDASFNKVAFVPRILGVQINDKVNQVSTFQVMLSTSSVDESLLTHGRVIGIFHWDFGEMRRGRISHLELKEVNDVPTVLVHCFSLAIELVWQDTYHGIGADNESASDIIDRILVDPETTWTKVVTGGSYVNVTNTFPPSSTWQTLLTLAEMENAYLRETSTLRQIEMIQTTPASNWHLFQTIPAIEVSRDLSVGYHREYYGKIEALDVFKNDGQAIINRLVPQGVSNADIILDLGLSNRSSPYTRQNHITDPPRVTNSAVFVESYNESETQERTLEINVTGQNRAIFAWEILDIPSSVVLPYPPTIDGKEGALLVSLNTGGTNHYLANLYMWRNPKPGISAIRLKYSSGGTADIKVMAVAVSGVRQNQDPVHDSDSAFATTGTSAATPSLTTTADVDLVLGFLLWTSGTASDAGDQTSILDQGGNAPAAQSARKVADGSTETMSWTLSVSQEWAVAGVSILPALVWYIEDSTSITNKGRRTARFVMNANRFVGATATELQNAANTLYDRAVTHLLRNKDGILHYDVKIGQVPMQYSAPNVGDTVHVVYRGFSENGFWVSIDANLITLERTRNVDAEGYLTFEFKFAPVLNEPVSIAELLYNTATRVGELETTQ